MLELTQKDIKKWLLCVQKAQGKFENFKIFKYLRYLIRSDIKDTLTELLEMKTTMSGVKHTLPGINSTSDSHRLPTLCQHSISNIS